MIDYFRTADVDYRDNKYIVIGLGEYKADAFVIDTAAEIIGYSRGMVLSNIQQKHIDAVRISGKYIISKAAIVDFLVSDIAFGIVNKSAWHMNTILMFSNKE